MSVTGSTRRDHAWPALALDEPCVARRNVQFGVLCRITDRSARPRNSVLCGGIMEQSARFVCHLVALRIGVSRHPRPHSGQAQGREGQAKEILAAIEGLRPGEIAPSLRGIEARARARLAAHRRQRDLAESMFKSAAAKFRDLGMPLWVATTLAEQAEWLRQEERSPWAGPERPAEAPGPGQLSARERELITLVAQGQTDAQIAAQLSISTRTVGSHLARIRDKTGCRRRVDLTRLALTAGLV